METEKLLHMNPFQFHGKRRAYYKHMNVRRAISHACPNMYVFMYVALLKSQK